MEIPINNNSDEEMGERPPGLRERKRQQTRERLTSVAMRLFLERGFEATTLDDIVAAADISRRTFFHYFASKEDLVFAWQDTFDDDLTAAVAARPPEEPPLRAAMNALVSLFGQFDLDEMQVLLHLVHDTPALRARDHIKYERLERTLAVTLSQRLGVEQTALQPRLVAMVAIGALRVASQVWLEEEGQRDTAEYTRQVFAVLRGELGEV